MDKKQYRVPLKVDLLVGRQEDEFKARLVSETPGCPLKGVYTLVESVHDDTDSGRLRAEEIDALSGMPILKITKRVDIVGCLALRDPVCYLERGSDRLLKVDSKETCPVYKRVIELLRL